MKLATTTGDFGAYTRNQAECIRYIHAAGFRCVDYNFGIDYADKTGVFGPDWQEYLQGIKALAQELGVTFVQSHAPMGTPIVRDEKYEAFIEANKRCIESCAILGIKCVVVHSGYEYGLTKEQCFERNKEFYMQLLPLAEKLGVNVLVENFNKMYKEGVYWIDNAPDLRALIDYVDHPMFHACWDAGHANMQDMPQDEALRMLGEHVLAVHIQDNMGDQDTHMLPLCGTLNLDEVMCGLLDIGYKGTFTFEVGKIFLPGSRRRPYERAQKLLNAPLLYKQKMEELIYEIGKHTLEAYGCFEG